MRSVAAAVCFWVSGFTGGIILASVVHGNTRLIPLYTISASTICVSGLLMQFGTPRRRYARIALALVLFALAASPAGAATILSEIDATFRGDLQFWGANRTIAYRWYPAPGSGNTGFNTSDADVGLLQSSPIAADTLLNSWYRFFDFSVENPGGGEHAFTINGGGGVVAMWSLQAEDLFTAANYGDGFAQEIEVTPHISLPNGNSFVGTGWYFSAMEFELHERTPGPTYDTLSFSVRFLGVPEPASLAMLFVGLIGFVHIRGRK